MSRRTSHGLFVVNDKGGKATKVLSGCIVALTWSPDGSAVAVERLRGDGFETVLVDVTARDNSDEV
jgi:hypothetical protein